MLPGLFTSAASMWFAAGLMGGWPHATSAHATTATVGQVPQFIPRTPSGGKDNTEFLLGMSRKRLSRWRFPGLTFASAVRRRYAAKCEKPAGIWGVAAARLRGPAARCRTRRR